MTMNTLHRFTAVTAFVVAIASTSVKGQIGPPPPPPTPVQPNLNPLRPQLTAPIGIQSVVQSQSTRVVLSWYQPVLTTTQAQPAAYFVVCLVDPAQYCAYGVNATGIWSAPAVGSYFSRTPVATGSPFATTPSLLRGYNYSLSVTLDSSYYNRYLVFKIGACASTSRASCTFTPNTAVAYSS